MTDTDTVRLPGYALALIALAGFLAARPQLPEPEHVQVRIHPRTGSRRVQVSLGQGADPLDC
jgi:hypothetical protein